MVDEVKNKTDMRWELEKWTAFFADPSSDPETLKRLKAAYDADNTPSWDQQAQDKLERLQKRTKSVRHGHAGRAARNAVKNYNPDRELLEWAIKNFFPKDAAFQNAAKADYETIHKKGAFETHVKERIAHLEKDENEGLTWSDFNPFSDDFNFFDDTAAAVKAKDHATLRTEWAVEHMKLQHSELDWRGAEHFGLDPEIFKKLDQQKLVEDEDIADRSTPIGKAYLNAAEIYYNDVNGEGAWDTYVKEEGLDAAAADQELAAYGESAVGWLQDNLTSASYKLAERSETAKIAMVYMAQLNTYKKSSPGDVLNMFGRSAADPSMWLGIGSGGMALGARFAAQIALKKGIQSILKQKLIATMAGSAIGGSIEGAISEVVLEVIEQKTGVDVNVRKNYNFSSAALRGSMGAVFGGVLGGAMGSGGHVLARHFKSWRVSRSLNKLDTSDATKPFNQFVGLIREAEQAAKVLGDNANPTPQQLKAFQDAMDPVLNFNAKDIKPGELKAMKAVHDALVKKLDDIQNDPNFTPPADAAAPSAKVDDVPRDVSGMSLKDQGVPDTKVEAEPMAQAADAEVIGVTEPEFPEALGRLVGAEGRPRMAEKGSGSGGGIGAKPEGKKAAPAPKAAAVVDADAVVLSSYAESTKRQINTLLEDAVGNYRNKSKADQAGVEQKFADDLKALRELIDGDKTLTDPEKTALLNEASAARKQFDAETQLALVQAAPMTAVERKAAKDADAEPAPARATDDAAPDADGAAAKEKVDADEAATASNTKPEPTDVISVRTKKLHAETPTKPEGAIGSFGNSTTLRHFIDNYDIALREFNDVVLNPDKTATPAQKQAALDTFTQRVADLRESAARLRPEKHEKLLDDAHALTPDWKKVLFGSRNSQTNINQLQQEGILDVSDAMTEWANKLAKDITSHEQAKNYLKGVNNRVNGGRKDWQKGDMFVVSTWKEGKAKGTEHGVSNTNQVRLLTRTLEQGAYAEPAPNTIIRGNVENIRKHLLEIFTRHSTDKQGEGYWKAVAADLARVMDEGYHPADMLAYLNTAVHRLDAKPGSESDPYNNYGDILKHLREILHESGRFDSVKVGDKIEIRDPYAKKMLIFLDRQNSRVWMENDEVAPDAWFTPVVGRYLGVTGSMGSNWSLRGMRKYADAWSHYDLIRELNATADTGKKSSTGKEIFSAKWFYRIPGSSLRYLSGSKIDWQETLVGEKGYLDNPTKFEYKYVPAPEGQGFARKALGRGATIAHRLSGGDVLPGLFRLIPDNLDSNTNFQNPLGLSYTKKYLNPLYLKGRNVQAAASVLGIYGLSSATAGVDAVFGTNTDYYNPASYYWAGIREGTGLVATGFDAVAGTNISWGYLSADGSSSPTPTPTPTEDGTGRTAEKLVDPKKYELALGTLRSIAGRKGSDLIFDSSSPVDQQKFIGGATDIAKRSLILTDKNELPAAINLGELAKNTAYSDAEIEAGAQIAAQEITDFADFANTDVMTPYLLVGRAKVTQDALIAGLQEKVVDILEEKNFGEDSAMGKNAPRIADALYKKGLQADEKSVMGEVAVILAEIDKKNADAKREKDARAAVEAYVAGGNALPKGVSKGALAQHLANAHPAGDADKRVYNNFDQADIEHAAAYLGRNTAAADLIDDYFARNAGGKQPLSKAAKGLIVDELLASGVNLEALKTDKAAADAAISKAFDAARDKIKALGTKAINTADPKQVTAWEKGIEAGGKGLKDLLNLWTYGVTKDPGKSSPTEFSRALQGTFNDIGGVFSNTYKQMMRTRSGQTALTWGTAFFGAAAGLAVLRKWFPFIDSVPVLGPVITFGILFFFAKEASYAALIGEDGDATDGDTTAQGSGEHIQKDKKVTFIQKDENALAERVILEEEYDLDGDGKPDGTLSLTDLDRDGSYAVSLADKNGQTTFATKDFAAASVIAGSMKFTPSVGGDTDKARLNADKKIKLDVVRNDDGTVVKTQFTIGGTTYDLDADKIDIDKLGLTGQQLEPQQ